MRGSRTLKWVVLPTLFALMVGLSGCQLMMKATEEDMVCGATIYYPTEDGAYEPRKIAYRLTVCEPAVSLAPGYVRVTVFMSVDEKDIRQDKETGEYYVITKVSPTGQYVKQDGLAWRQSGNLYWSACPDNWQEKGHYRVTLIDAIRHRRSLQLVMMGVVALLLAPIGWGISRRIAASMTARGPQKSARRR